MGTIQPDLECFPSRVKYTKGEGLRLKFLENFLFIHFINVYIDNI